MGAVDDCCVGSCNSIHSPFEAALRTLVILCHASPQCFDISQIAVLDYLLVHSADLDGPESAHPATPYRSGEALILVELAEKGAHLLISRGLVEIEFTEEGIAYRALDLGASFLDALQSPYIKKLRDRANWLADILEEKTPEMIRENVASRISTWGVEFDTEALLGQAEYE